MQTEMKWGEKEVCECGCHRQEAANTGHCMCCEFHHKTYITHTGKLLTEKYENLLRDSYMEFIKYKAIKNKGLDENFVRLQLAMMGGLANDKIIKFCKENMK